MSRDDVRELAQALREAADHLDMYCCEGYAKNNSPQRQRFMALLARFESGEQAGTDGKGAGARTPAEDAVLRAAVVYRTVQDRPMLLRAEARRQLEEAVDALPADHPARERRHGE